MVFTLMVGGCYLFPDVMGDAKELEKLSYEEQIDFHWFNDLPPLHQAVARGDFLEVRRLLSSGDTNVKEVDEFGNTALHYCCRDERIAELLISKGADIYASNNAGENPLLAIMGAIHYGESGKLEKIIRMLLMKDRHNKMVQSRNRYGDTPLHCASSPNVVRMCLCAGADVNARNDEGNTLLHCVVICTQDWALEMVRILLEEGHADTTVRNNEGLTPAGVAIKHGNTKAAELIFNHQQKQ